MIPVLYATVRVERFDRTTQTWLGEIPERIGGVGLPISSSSQEFTLVVAVLDQDRKIYYSRAREGGLVVGDPATGEQLAHIDLDPFAAGRGLTDNVVVGPDDRFLYAAVRGQESGLVEIDAETDEVTRQVASIDGRGIDVAIHPGGGLLWLTTHDDDPAEPTPSLLIDADRMGVIEFFPRPVLEGTETRWVLAVTFHPDGNPYQARDDDIDVYLIR